MKNFVEAKSNTQFKTRFIKLVALIGCFAFVFGFAFAFSNISSNFNGNSTVNAAIDPDSYGVTLNDAYDALAHGSTYTYTDKSLVDGFRAGQLSSDTTTVKVNRRAVHGSKENPYVINSIDGDTNGKGGWNKFVSEMANAANNYGKGEYFVLTSDLDWKSGAVAFNQVIRFDGYFFGLGHIFKNIVKSFNNTPTYAGVFRELKASSVLADLCVENAKWTDTWNGSGLVADGSPCILNCHTSGNISNSPNNMPSGTETSRFGGIMLYAQDGTFIYRCSSKWSTLTYADSNYGVQACCIVTFAMKDFTCYDCYVDLNVDATEKRSNMYSSLFGVACTSGQNIKVDNVYATLYINEVVGKFQDELYVGSIISGYHSPGIALPSDYSISYSNIYVDGSITMSGSRVRLPLSNYYASGPVLDTAKISKNNLNYASYYGDYILHKQNISTIPYSSATGYDTNEKFVAAIKKDSAFSNWNRDKLDPTKYSVADNPVYNTSIKSSNHIAKFYNYKDGNGESLKIDDVEYDTTKTFPTPATSPAGHEFLGWTTDIKDDEHFFEKDSKFTSDIYGDVVFYAVWDIAESDLTDDFTASATSIEYLTGAITLSATIKAASMPEADTDVSYLWKFKSNTLGDSKSSITKENVNDSGTYTLEYCIRSKSQPLWRHSGTHTQEIEIKPGKLTPQSMKVDKIAYYGMEFASLTPTVVMVNSQGKTVDGVAKWSSNMGKVTDNPDDKNYQKGKVYRAFYFEPDGQYNGNYESGSNIVYNEKDSQNIVYFNAQFIQIEFNMPDINKTLSFDFKEYGGTLSYSRIASKFDEVFAVFYDDNKEDLDSMDINGYTPQLKFTDGTFLNINDYRKKPSGYQNVVDTMTIEVKFVEATYTVTYIFDDDGKTPDDKLTGIKYGQHLLKPSPNPTNGVLMFLGWYYPALDENGNPIKEPNGDLKYLKWDFDVNRIVGDLVLTAKWLKAESLDHIEIVANKPSYKALSSIGPGDLTVTAYYIGKDGDGNPITMPVPLDFSQYKDNIEYVGNRPGDNTLHVDRTGVPTKITISYSYFNVQNYTDTRTVEIIVDPLKIDISDLDIKDKTVLFDGNVQSIDELDLAVLQHLSDPNSRKITGVKYTYYFGRDIIAPSEVIALGDYDVYIEFSTNDPDFAVEPITVRLSIVSELPPDQTDPTPPGTGDDDNPPNNDGNNVLDKIKEFFDKLIASGFPLWQVCTMAVAGLLTLIFLIKTIQYGNRKKKAKGEVKKLNAKTYAALAPIFSTEVVYAGLTNQIWSIIAFSLVGLALIMFMAALISRRAWKKAELAKETAIENVEQRKVEAQKQEREAELQERREFKEQLALMSSSQIVPSVDSMSLIEEMRREMEAREERYRREEEERRREDEERHRQEMDAMKLMLANMMGRQQGDNGDMPYYGTVDDTDLIADKVFAKLLPAVQQMMPDTTAYLAAPGYEESESDIEAIADRVAQKLGAGLNISHTDNSEEMQAMADKIDDLQNQLAVALSQPPTTVYVEKESEDDDIDDEEEWDCILDEDDDDFVEAVVIEEDGTVKKTSPNFRMRLKQSSDKNREWYTVIKNMFCSQKGVTYRVYKRVEKIRYQGQVVAVIGIAKRSIKLWLALKPYEYDARRYHHKDVSDKPRFVDVPMYVRVGSDRALTRAQELILALFQELNMEARKRYNDRSIQELIFTLKHNRLLTNKQNKQLLCEVMHVHDCDVLDDETAEKCIETKNVDFIDYSVIETIKLDDIDAAFQDGNRVTLEKLKKVGLVSEECTGYNVVADKRLTKPLIIVANDFNLTAVKLITLTGGRAIKLQQV